MSQSDNSMTEKYAQARRLLGRDFIPPERIIKACRHIYTEAQLKRLGSTLPEKSVIKWCRDNHCILIAVPWQKMSFLDIWHLTWKCFDPNAERWYAVEDVDVLH